MCRLRSRPRPHIALCGCSIQRGLSLRKLFGVNRLKCARCKPETIGLDLCFKLSCGVSSATPSVSHRSCLGIREFSSCRLADMESPQQVF